MSERGEKKSCLADKSLAAGLREVASSSDWFKLSEQEESEFVRARFAESQSLRDGFVLGGPLKQII